MQSHPILCLVTARGACRGELAASVRAAVEAGVDWVQIRERELEGAALLAHASELAEAAQRGADARGGSVRVLVNRRIDIALAIGADGVQLGFDAVGPEHARGLLGPTALIGVSTHTLDEIGSVPAAANYAQLAPIFPPLSKPATRPAVGLELLARAASISLPLLAQGGITPDNAPAVVATGARGIAVTGTILGAPDPAAMTARIRKALDGARRD